jgi:hypothetical protein
VAIRVVRGFRTIATTAAAVLLGFPPFELQALRCREIYLCIRRLLDGVDLAGADVRIQPRQNLLESRRNGLDNRARAPGLRVVEVILPNWDVLLNGGRLPLMYSVTLTGHGCFGEYLRRIEKEATIRCHHCDERVDSA